MTGDARVGVLDLFQARALANLEARKASAPRPMANDRRRAGKPMVYYCRVCGWISDILPEDYFLAVPRRLCGECQAMEGRDWLPR